MRRLKIKIDHPDKINPLLYKALSKGYHYKADNFESIKHAQGLLLHPEYGVYPVRDEEFDLHVDFETISYEEFMR